MASCPNCGVSAVPNVDEYAIEERRGDGYPCYGGSPSSCVRIIARSRPSGASDVGLTVCFQRVTRSSKISSPKRNTGETGSVLVGVLRRAREMHARLREPGVGNCAGLAPTLGVSRAHISQSMAVLDAPGGLIDTLSRAEETGRPVTLAAWRKVKGLSEQAAIGKRRELGYP